MASVKAKEQVIDFYLKQLAPESLISADDFESFCAWLQTEEGQQALADISARRVLH